MRMCSKLGIWEGKKVKRLACVCCCLLLCCTFVGCQRLPAQFSSDEPINAVTDTPSDTAALAFNEEDTLNPFAAKTALNASFTTLLYDSLVTINAEFMPQDSMATVVQTDPTHLVATLKSNLVFSDGTAVSAADVVYAFECAKASTIYGVRLAGFTDAKAKGNTVTFTLREADIYAAANLHFPIIKKGTATTDAARAPIGSGAYVFNADTKTLTRNPHHKGETVAQTISLVHLVSDAAIVQALENGTIQYMYDDLSSGDIPRTSSQNKAVDLTQLVYIGVNSQHPLLGTAAYRKALSAAVDRITIASAAYAGRALPADSPFHPKWKKAAGLSCISAGAQADALQVLVKEAYADAATATTATTVAGTTVTTTLTDATATTTAQNVAQMFSLIYPDGNNCREAAVKMLTAQFAAAGITVTPTPLSFEAYTARLQAGDFDLYLGEIRLTPNMDLSPLLQAGGSAALGTDTATPASTAYVACKAGSGTTAMFVTAFGEQMPYIPLFWRQGMVACTDSFTAITPVAYDLFNGVLKTTV